MPGLDYITYSPLTGTIPLDDWTWHAGGSVDMSPLIQVPEEILNGPVAVRFDGSLVAIVGRSIDFQPHSVIMRDDMASSKQPTGITIRTGRNLRVRAETNPGRPALLGHGGKPETDLLIVEGDSGLLIRLA